jgi:hypothetical protein
MGYLSELIVGTMRSFLERRELRGQARNPCILPVSRDALLSDSNTACRPASQDLSQRRCQSSVLIQWPNSLSRSTGPIAIVAQLVSNSATHRLQQPRCAGAIAPYAPRTAISCAIQRAKMWSSSLERTHSLSTVSGPAPGRIISVRNVGRACSLTSQSRISRD